MKTFLQFKEDASSDYEASLSAYERSGKVVRTRGRQRGEAEAAHRRQKSKEFAQRSKEKAASAGESGLKRLENVKQRTTNREHQRMQNRQSSRERIKRGAHDATVAAKGALQASKSVVKFVKNRLNRRNDQQTGQRRTPRG